MAKRSLFRRLVYDGSRHTARVLFSAFFHIRCTGRSHWPADGAILVCANHQSYLDPVLVGLTCLRPMNYLARKSLFNFFLLRWLIVFMDAIPIEREGLGIGGLKETMRRLRRGEVVLMFPEGTRTTTGALSPIKPGFCPLVRRTQAHIVPLAIDGAFQAWTKGQTLPRPGTIHVCVGDPIDPEQIAAWSDERLVDAVTTRMQQCLAIAQSSRQRALR